MKYLVTLISMIYTINGFSQTINPDLFQTWYLYDITSSDTGQHFPVSAVNPTISPNVTFTASLDFYGEGACNSFTGSFSLSNDDILVFNNFGSTLLLLCEYPGQISYEGSFFSLMQSGGQYAIIGEGDNMTLAITTPIFETYLFRNSQLSSASFDLNQTVIHPNPVTSRVFVQSQNNTLDKIEIFNSLGQAIKSVDTGFNVIDVSDLAAGIYFIKLHAKQKTVCKKIIKE